MYTTLPTKKPLNFHVMELPFQPGVPGVERNIGLRFFDEATREMGTAVISVPPHATAQDVCTEAEKHILPEWGISGQLRLLEVVESRIQDLHKPDTAVRNFSCFSKANLFYHCLRVEADPENVHAPMSANDGQKLVELYHCDRATQQSFGQPFLMSIAPGEKSLQVKNRIKAKLRIPDMEFKTWRLIRINRGAVPRTHLKDDDAWDLDSVGTDVKICIEHNRPNPNGGSPGRQFKQLTIK